MQVNLALAGLTVGFLIGLSGVGGGALMAPLLLVLGIEPAVVVGSDLAFGLLTKCAGVGLHVRHHAVRWGWVWLMASGSIPGALLGAFLVRQLASAPQVLRYWIGVMLVVTPVVAVLFEYARHRRVSWIEALRHPRGWMVALVGGVVGVVAGATSVGSGSLIDMALVLFSPLTGVEIVGTGIAHAILLSGVASFAHWRLGSVDPPLVLNLLLGSIPGVLLGASLAHHASPRPLRWGIAALVLVSGVSIISTTMHP
jgi:uncharacterized membrane protein YfcA